MSETEILRLSPAIWLAGVLFLALGLFAIHARDGTWARRINAFDAGDGWFTVPFFAFFWPFAVPFGAFAGLCWCVWRGMHWALRPRHRLADLTLDGEEFTPALERVDAALVELESITPRQVQG